MASTKKSSFRNKSSSGTKRLPKGRLVIDSQPSTRANRMAVVVGSAIEIKTNRRVILINPGRKDASEIVNASDLSPVTIRRDVIGLKGKGSIKPRVSGKITTEKIRALKTTTQRQLDRAGG